MRELVREKSRFGQAGVRIHQRVLVHAIVAALVMLLPKAHHVVAQGQQKVIIAKMMRLIESAGFRHEVFVVLDQIRGDLERPGIVGGYVQFVRGTSAGI
jgi:uncharacterized protein YbcI